MQPALKVELRHLVGTTLQPEPAGRQATAVHSGGPPARCVLCGLVQIGTGHWQGRIVPPLPAWSPGHPQTSGCLRLHAQWLKGVRLSHTRRHSGHSKKPSLWTVAEAYFRKGNMIPRSTALPWLNSSVGRAFL